MITSDSVELARRAFLVQMRDKLMGESLPLLMKEACELHPTKVGIVLKMILDCPTGQVRQMEACLSLDELLRDAAIDMAEQIWMDLKQSIPLREAA